MSWELLGVTSCDLYSCEQQSHVVLFSLSLSPLIPFFFVFIFGFVFCLNVARAAVFFLQNSFGGTLASLYCKKNEKKKIHYPSHHDKKCFPAINLNKKEKHLIYKRYLASLKQSLSFLSWVSSWQQAPAPHPAKLEPGEKGSFFLS